MERLSEGVVIGDGGFCFALEKRGYVKVGVWTPQCTVLHPEAGASRRTFTVLCMVNFVQQNYHAL